MNNCPHCEKTYKTIGKLNNHILINHSDKVISPSQKEMWFIIKDLIKKNEQQEKRIQKLERVINKDIKNINILDWLNKNDKGIEIDIWLKTSVNVTLDDLYMIFNTDYYRGLSNILINNIIDNENNPFRCFSHKVKQLYIFEKGMWKKSKKVDIIKIFDRLSLNILKRSKDYDNSLSQNEKFGSDNMQYLKNCEKIMVVDTKKKERYYKFIESNIISLTTQNLNDMAKFKFYI